MSIEGAVRSVAVACASICALVFQASCSGSGSGSGAHEAWSYQSQRGVAAVFQPAPADVSLYRSLLPTAFEVPQQPRVLVAVVSYDDVTAPLVPYREGYVMLACTYQEEAGWYTLTMPVTDQTASDAGHAIGFPKYVADRIDLTDGGDGTWAGEVVSQGESVLRVLFTPQAPGTPVPGTAQPDAVAFTLLPPGQGPDVDEVGTTQHQAQRVLVVSGTATVTFAAGEPWAELLTRASPVSAQFAEATGDWNLVAQKR
jgi:hypothetical protein